MDNSNRDFEIRRQLLQMQMLYEIGLAINDSLDPTQVVEEILNRAVVMVDARVGLLIMREGEDRKILGQVGIKCDLFSILAMPEVISAWNERKLSQYQAETPAGKYLCIVPLVSRSETEGLLIFVDKEKRGSSVGPFDEQDETLLQSFAYQAGASLHNARLHENLEVAYEQLKIAQRKLAQMEQLRALGELGAQVAHAMNHVLGIIAGHADLYLNFGRDPEKTVKTIIETAESGQSIMKRIQQFSRLNVGKKRVQVEMVNLIEKVAANIQVLWHDRSGTKAALVEWFFHLQPVPASYANPTDLEEAISNIMLNALEAMPDGGKLEITCYHEREFFNFSVRDTGVGMNEEIKKKIFTPFFSTKEEWGTGLGLAIAYRIITDHEGEIGVESGVGEGSCFTIRLPIKKGPKICLEDHNEASNLDS